MAGPVPLQQAHGEEDGLVTAGAVFAVSNVWKGEAPGTTGSCGRCH
jgi:hypothetical protein